MKHYDPLNIETVKQKVYRSYRQMKDDAEEVKSRRRIVYVSASILLLYGIAVGIGSCVKQKPILQHDSFTNRLERVLERR